MSDTYKRTDPSLVFFCKAKDPFGFLGNMAGGYPFWIWFPDGTSQLVHTSEALYQALKFPDYPEIQRDILGEPNGFKAKLIAKGHLDKVRADWPEVQLPAMRLALVCKAKANKQVLSGWDNKYPVEISSKDAFWGAVKQADDSYVGANFLGESWSNVKKILAAEAEGSTVIRADLRFTVGGKVFLPYHVPRPTCLKEAVDWISVWYPLPDDFTGTALSLHHTLGRQIRNDLGLWDHENCEYQSEKYTHPDEISNEIIETYLESRGVKEGK